jgi:pyruvate/2-oxoglutarate/acetoin dehydrogenase E1 component
MLRVDLDRGTGIDIGDVDYEQPAVMRIYSTAAQRADYRSVFCLSYPLTLRSPKISTVVETCRHSHATDPFITQPLSMKVAISGRDSGPGQLQSEPTIGN